MPRNPASVEKLYTLSTVLARFGLDGTLQTSIYGVGKLGSHGRFRGNLYLRGGGDPTFGDAAFIKQNYGTGTSVQALVKLLVANVALRKVKGSIVGDESYFDSLRGGPSTGFAVDPEPCRFAERARLRSRRERRGGLAAGLRRVPAGRRSARTAAWSSPAARTPGS